MPPAQRASRHRNPSRRAAVDGTPQLLRRPPTLCCLSSISLSVARAFIGHNEGRALSDHSEGVAALAQSLIAGVSPGQGTGATMSDDEDDPIDSDANLFDGGLDSPDSMGFGPLIPKETERSFMERVRQELTHELKQGNKEKIVDDKRGDFTQEESGEASRGYNVSPKSLVAVAC